MKKLLFIILCCTMLTGCNVSINGESIINVDDSEAANFKQTIDKFGEIGTELKDIPEEDREQYIKDNADKYKKLAGDSIDSIEDIFD